MTEGVDHIVDHVGHSIWLGRLVIPLMILLLTTLIRMLVWTGLVTITIILLVKTVP